MAIYEPTVHVPLEVDQNRAVQQLRISRSNSGLNTDLLALIAFGPNRIDNEGLITFETISSGFSPEVPELECNPLERMRIHTNGNVGIGTLSPFAKLSVSGTPFQIRQVSTTADSNKVTGSGTSFLTQIDEGDLITIGGKQKTVTSVTGDLTLEVDSVFSTDNSETLMDVQPDIFRADDSSGNTAFIISKEGNVGIGTPSPVAKLSINGGLHVGGDSDPGNDNLLVDGDIAISGKHAFRGSDSWLRLNQDKEFASGVRTPGVFAPMSLNVGGASNWGNPGNGNVWITGKVGIGTPSPGAKLSINGGLQVGGADICGDPGDGNVCIIGNVGIGTPAHAAKLTVKGTIPFNLKLKVRLGFGSNSNIVYNESENPIFSNLKTRDIIAFAGKKRMIKDTYHKLDYVDLYNIPGYLGPDANLNEELTAVPSPLFRAEDHNGNPKLFISSDGNVGIGTEKTVGRLTIKGIVEPQQGLLTFFSKTADMEYDGGNDGVFIFKNTATNGKTAFMGGNVGIGTPTPQNKLDVEGSAVIGEKYAGTETAPTNGLLVQGKVGIGTKIPRNPLGIQANGKSEELISFEDPNGNTKWHINQNLDGNKPGLNFVETGVADGRLFIQVGGKVGIGTNDPKARLHVGGDSDPGNNNLLVDGDIYFKSNFALLHYGNRGRLGSTPNFNPDDDNNGLWLEGSTDGIESGGIFMNGNTMCLWSPGDNDLLRIYDEDDFSIPNLIPKFMISGSGKVGIGTDDPGAKLEVTGNAGVLNLVGKDHVYIQWYPHGASKRKGWIGWGSGTYNKNIFTISNEYGKVEVSMGSDIRLKKNIEAATNVLSKVLKLQPVYFNYKNDPDTEPKQIGVIAQELESIFPELVTHPEEGSEEHYLGVDFVPFSLIAIQAIKELHQKLVALQEKLNDLKTVEVTE